MQVTHEQSPGTMMSAVHAVLICGGCFLGNVRVMMSVVHAVVWACRLWNGQVSINAEAAHRPTSGMDMSQ
jgi:hypothetical protein